MKRHSLLVAGVLAVALLASCSSVFTSTITGTVEELDGTTEIAVEGVDVYAYLSQSERDSAVSAGTQPTTTVRIFHAITDANGDYSMPVEWSTTSPTFGKTADRIPVYLAFYHKDFNDGKPSAATTVSYLSSERTNTMETESLTRTSDSYTLYLTQIYDVSGTNYSISPTNFTVTVKDAGGNTLYQGTPTGTSVSFSASTTSPLTGTVTIVPNNSAEYVQCNEEGGSDIQTIQFSLATKNSTNPAEPAYMKHLVLSARTVEGQYEPTSGTANGFTVKLFKGNSTDGTLITTTTTAPYDRTSTTSMQGYFTLTIPEETISAYSSDSPKLYTETYTIALYDTNSSLLASTTVSVTTNPQEDTTKWVTIEEEYT